MYEKMARNRLISGLHILRRLLLSQTLHDFFYFLGITWIKPWRDIFSTELLINFESVAGGMVSTAQFLFYVFCRLG